MTVKCIARVGQARPTLTSCLTLGTSVNLIIKCGVVIGRSICRSSLPPERTVRRCPWVFSVQDQCELRKDRTAIAMAEKICMWMSSWSDNISEVVVLIKTQKNLPQLHLFFWMPMFCILSPACQGDIGYISCRTQLHLHCKDGLEQPLDCKDCWDPWEKKLLNTWSCSCENIQ